MEEIKKACQLCFFDFNNGERRPRVIPCGHTFCSNCITDNFKENLLLCPNCRKKHHATTPTDFPVNFELEGMLFNAISSPSIKSEISSLSDEQSKPMSKKLKSMTEELSNGMEDKATNNKEVRSQLLQYQTVITEREMLHKQIREKHLAIVHQNDDIIDIMRKEQVKIVETLKEEEEETQRMKTVNDKLHSSNSAHEILSALEEATHCYDVLQKWNHETQDNFPDSQLLTKSVKLVEKSQKLLQTLPDYEEEIVAEITSVEAPGAVDLEAEDSTDILQTDIITSSPSVSEKESSTESHFIHSKLSVEEKVKRTLDNASARRDLSSSVKDFQEKSIQTHRMASQIVSEWRHCIIIIFIIISSIIIKELTITENGIREGQIYAFQHFEGKRRYAKVSFNEENKTMIHCLRERELPPNAITVKHRDVMSLVDPSSRKVFLEFGTNSSTLGKILISLTPGSKRAQNFFLLCSGESGPSFLNSVIFEVRDKGRPGEYIRTGDYELNNGKGGKAVVQGAGNEKGGEFSQSYIAGSICGLFFVNRDADASQFGIVTKDKVHASLRAKFGQVESGLDILREAIANYPNISDVKIIDCGVVLSI